AVLQKVLDLNTGASGAAPIPVVVPRSNTSQSTGMVEPASLYRISSPLVVNDYVSLSGSPSGVNTTRDLSFQGSGLDNRDFFGPCIVNGYMGTGSAVPTIPETNGVTSMLTQMPTPNNSPPVTYGYNYLCLSDYAQTNHLNNLHLNMLTLEFWINPLGDAPAAGTSYYLAQSGGSIHQTAAGLAPS